MRFPYVAQVVCTPFLKQSSLLRLSDSRDYRYGPTIMSRITNVIRKYSWLGWGNLIKFTEGLKGIVAGSQSSKAAFCFLFPKSYPTLENSGQLSTSYVIYCLLLLALQYCNRLILTCLRKLKCGNPKPTHIIIDVQGAWNPVLVRTHPEICTGTHFMGTFHWQNFPES